MSAPEPRRVLLAVIPACLCAGWRTFRASAGVSVAFAGTFAVLGLVVLGMALKLGAAPMAVPLAGAFMLVGPVLLAGFFRVAETVDSGGRPRARDVLAGFREAPRALWPLAGVCMLLVMIWVTDAAILFSFMLGLRPAGDWVPRDLAVFEFWGSVAGAFLALILYAISAFSIPLILERRATLVTGVVASVRVVLGNPALSLPWGLLLAVATIGSVLVTPLLPVTLPVLAYASRALYREVFPSDPESR